jgi:polygalacturonase
VTRKLRVDAKLPREAEHPPGAPLRWPRPRVINFMRCRDVLIDGITIRDGALH